MFKTLTLFFALITATFCGASPLLMERFAQAQKGDYVVIQLNKNYTLLHIFDKTPTTAIIEEITVPAPYVGTLSWPDWVSQGAPHHTSWLMAEVDLQSSRILECYSFTQHGWIEIEGGENFLKTLLHLDITPLPPQNRKKVGPPNIHGLADRRPLWNPPLVFQGKTVLNAPFNAWQAEWPNDGTELAGKTIDVYLPEDMNTYPSCFPYWIEVRGGLVKTKVRVKDSGKDLVSPKTHLPRRQPPQKTLSVATY